MFARSASIDKLIEAEKVALEFIKEADAKMRKKK